MPREAEVEVLGHFQTDKSRKVLNRPTYYMGSVTTPSLAFCRLARYCETPSIVDTDIQEDESYV